MFNIFHTIYSQAERGDNSFVHTHVSWESVPGRDATWAKEQIDNLGQRQFDQEFAVKFIGSTNTLIDSETLKIILSSWKEPVMTDLNGKLKIWEKPQTDAIYVMGVDPAKGTGENYSTVQILKFKSINPVELEQVAVFRDNLTDIYEFSEIVNRLSIYYKNAYIMVENNGEGSSVVQRLWWEFENENLINQGSKASKLGIRANKTTKTKAVLLMKKLIEDRSLRLYDNDTTEELGSFIEEGGKFFGKDKPDDLVSALYWACFFLEMNILDETYKFIEKEEDDEVWGVLDDVNNIVENWDWLADTKLYEL